MGDQARAASTAGARTVPARRSVPVALLLCGLFTACSEADAPTERGSATTTTSDAAPTTTSDAAPTTDATEVSCPTAPDNPPVRAGRAAVEAASLPLPKDWSVRDSLPGWVAFGPGTSETQGGNLLRPMCILTADGDHTPVPRDVEQWLRERQDLRAQVVDRLTVQGRQGFLVSIPTAATIWCVAPYPNACFNTPAVYGVVPTTDGLVVIDGFGANESQTLRNTRSLVKQLQLD